MKCEPNTVIAKSSSYFSFNQTSKFIYTSEFHLYPYTFKQKLSVLVLRSKSEPIISHSQSEGISLLLLNMNGMSVGVCLANESLQCPDMTRQVLCKTSLRFQLTDHFPMLSSFYLYWLKGANTCGPKTRQDRTTRRRSHIERVELIAS